jgi:hypothetical protein
MRRADNFTAICDPIVYTMWDPHYLTSLYAPTTCHEDSFTSLFTSLPLNGLQSLHSPCQSAERRLCTFDAKTARNRRLERLKRRDEP